MALDLQAGELKSSLTEVNPANPGAIGNGAEAAAKTDTPSMAANSPASPAGKRARRNTGSVSLTERLEILQQSLYDYMIAGGQLSIIADGPDLAVTLKRVSMPDGNFILKETTCPTNTIP